MVYCELPNHCPHQFVPHQSRMTAPVGREICIKSSIAKHRQAQNFLKQVAVVCQAVAVRRVLCSFVMAPAYKLTYFNVPVLGEPIRFLFKYGGIEFEDYRLQKEDWPALKPLTPFGQVPILEHDGKIAHQSTAICRYVAKKVKLSGKDDWEDLEIDATVDTLNELRAKIAEYFYETDETIKENKQGPLFNETLPFYLKQLDAQAKKNNGYLAAGRLTWADLHFVGMLDYINHIAKKDITAGSPNLQKVKENVLSIPNIKAWVQERPKVNF